MTTTDAFAAKGRPTGALVGRLRSGEERDGNRYEAVMNPKRVLRDRMSHIFKTWVTPTLHEAGFKKRGIVYVRELGSVQHLFQHESGTYNTADKFSFTTNCGIHMPGVTALHAQFRRRGLRMQMRVAGQLVDVPLPKAPPSST